MMKRINKLLPQSGRLLLSGELVGGDLTVTFAGSSEANTQKVVIVGDPTEQEEGRDPVQAYKIAVNNPSTITGLTIKVFTVEKDFGGMDQDCLLETLDIPKAQLIKGTLVEAYEFLVGGIFCGGDLKIVASNDTALGAAEGFAATIRIREV